MLDAEILQKVLRATLSRGGDYADVFVEMRRSTNLVLEDDKLEKVTSGSIQGVGIRLIFEGKTAYAISNDLSERALVDAAYTLSRARVSDKWSSIDIDLRSIVPTVKMSVAIPPDTVSMDDKIAIMYEANKAVRGFGSEIKQCSVIYRDSLQKVQIATSEGRLVEDTRTHSVGVTNVVAERDGVVQTGYEPIGGHIGFEIFNDEALVIAAKNSATRAINLLSARQAPGGRMPVVISSEAGGTMIHEAIGHGLEADLAGAGLSKFSDRIGQQVSSKLVTVVDDATMPGKRGSFSFDDEGNPAERTILVKDGVLMGYMNDKMCAMRHNVAPTGNGRRESYSSRPIPRMTNTIIVPGLSKPEDVLASTSSGLLVRVMGGGQVNTVSGDFVFDVIEGYLIEGGKQGELVRGATLTGNGPEALSSIDMVGTDLGFSIGTCGKDSQGVPVSDAMPTLRIPEMVVGGEVAQK